MKRLKLRSTTYAVVLTVGASSGCAAAAPIPECTNVADSQAVKLDDLRSNYPNFIGGPLKVDACLGVSDHGVMLKDCEVSTGRWIVVDKSASLSVAKYEFMMLSANEVRRRAASAVRVLVSGTLSASSGGPMPVLSLRVEDVKCLDVAIRQAEPGQ